jgi:uncharacterized protein
MKLMQLTQEARQAHTIVAYDAYHIQVGDASYTQSLIISATTIISPWPVRLHQLDATAIQFLLDLKPEVILIGHNASLPIVSEALARACSTHQVGIEQMSIGAACRTFNILLGEDRRVVLGVML